MIKIAGIEIENFQKKQKDRLHRSVSIKYFFRYANYVLYAERLTATAGLSCIRISKLKAATNHGIAVV